MIVARLLWRMIKLAEIGGNLAVRAEDQFHQQYAANKPIGQGYPDTCLREVHERISFRTLPGRFLQFAPKV